MARTASVLSCPHSKSFQWQNKNRPLSTMLGSHSSSRKTLKHDWMLPHVNLNLIGYVSFSCCTKPPGHCQWSAEQQQPLARLLTLRRRQADVGFKELAPSSPSFDTVRHRLAHLPHAEVEELGDREGTDNHLGGNTSPTPRVRRGLRDDVWLSTLRHSGCASFTASRWLNRMKVTTSRCGNCFCLFYHHIILLTSRQRRKYVNK